MSRSSGQYFANEAHRGELWSVKNVRCTLKEAANEIEETDDDLAARCRRMASRLRGGWKGWKFGLEDELAEVPDLRREAASKLAGLLSNRPDKTRFPRQDSVTDQLRDVHQKANEMGCYDAADWIRNQMGWE